MCFIFYSDYIIFCFIYFLSFFFFFLMIRRPPRSTPFPTRRSSDLVRELLETLRQNCPRYERRRAEQFAERAGTEAQLSHDDRGPSVTEDFGGFCDGAKLSVCEHGAIIALAPRLDKYVFRT